MSKTKSDAPVQKAAGQSADQKQGTPSKQGGPQQVARQQADRAASSDQAQNAHKRAALMRNSKQNTVSKLSRLLSRAGQQDNKSSPSVGPDTREALRKTGEGQPLPDRTRGKMENSFGVNLSGVRVHTDSQADKANRELNANAFATGQDIYFAQGRYQPDTAQGNHLIAHEVAHTVQQSSTPVSRQAEDKSGKQPAMSTPQVSQPGDRVEREAESAAQQISSGKPVAAGTITRMSNVQPPARNEADQASVSTNTDKKPVATDQDKRPVHKADDKPVSPDSAEKPVTTSQEKQSVHKTADDTPIKTDAAKQPDAQPVARLFRAEANAIAPEATLTAAGTDQKEKSPAAPIRRAEAGGSASAPAGTAPGAPPPAAGKGERGVSLASATFTLPPDMATDGGGKGGEMDVPVYFGQLARGNIKVHKTGDSYSTERRQMIPLMIPALDPLRAAKIEPVLALDISKGTISGFITISRGSGPAGNPEVLMEEIKKHTREFGWAGIDISRVPDVKSSLKDGTLTFQVENFPFKLGGFLDGTANFGLTNEQVTFSGNANVQIGGVANAALDLKRDEKGVIAGNTELNVNLSKFSGKIKANFAGGIVDIQGTVGYKTEKMSGEITLLLVDAETANNLAKQQLPPQKIEAKAQEVKAPAEEGAGPKPGPRKLAGYGTVDFAFTDWLAGKATVIVDGKGDITIIGKIAPPAEKVLFDQRDYSKQLVKLEVRAPYGIPVIGNVYLFANVALIAEARIGPAKIYNIEIEGVYSTDPTVLQNFQMAASFNMSAYAGLKLRGEGGAGLELLGHDLKMGAGLNAIAGVKGYVDARPTIGYREKADPKAGKKGEFFVKGHMELAAQPFLGLSGDLFVEVDSPWWSPLPDKKWTWPLGQLEYPLPGEFGLGADVDYVLGSKELPEIKFSEAKFDSNKFMTDIVREQAPKKSGKGEQEKPATFAESGDTKNAALKGGGGKGAAGGGAKPGKTADTSPAKPSVQPGGKKKDKKPPADPKAKADGDKKKQEMLKGGKDTKKLGTALEKPFTMKGQSHKLIFDPTVGELEMESTKDKFSAKIKNAIKVHEQQKPKPQKTIKMLEKMLKDAQSLQKEVKKLGLQLSDSKDKWPQELQDELAALLQDLQSYATTYNAQDILTQIVEEPGEETQFVDPAHAAADGLSVVEGIEAHRLVGVEKHHSFFKYFLGALGRAGLKTRDAKGRRVKQDLVKLGTDTHQGLHQLWDDLSKSVAENLKKSKAPPKKAPVAPGLHRREGAARDIADLISTKVRPQYDGVKVKLDQDWVMNPKTLIASLENFYNVCLKDYPDELKKVQAAINDVKAFIFDED